MQLNWVTTTSTNTAGVVAALVALVGFGLKYVGVELPTEVVSSLTVLLGWVTANLVPDSKAQTQAAFLSSASSTSSASAKSESTS